MFTKKYMLAGELEVTYKIDPSPAATDAIEAFDVNFKFNRINNEKNIGGVNLGSLPSWVSTRDVEVTFKTYIKTNGTTSGMFGRMLQACAWAEAAGVYTFDTDPATGDSMTFWFYQDGLVTKVNGCRGTVNLNFPAGEFATAEWTFKGLYNQPTASAIVAPDWEAGSAFIVESSDFEMGSGANVNYIENFSIKQAGLESFMDINGAQGFGRSFVVDAIFTGSIDPEVTPANIVTWETAINASTTYALNYVLGAGVGNIITITAPAVQVTEGVLADKRGIQVMNLDLNFRTTEAGASPITITVS